MAKTRRPAMNTFSVLTWEAYVNESREANMFSYEIGTFLSLYSFGVAPSQKICSRIEFSLTSVIFRTGNSFWLGIKFLRGVFLVFRHFYSVRNLQAKW